VAPTRRGPKRNAREGCRGRILKVVDNRASKARQLELGDAEEASASTRRRASAIDTVPLAQLAVPIRLAVLNGLPEKAGWDSGSKLRAEKGGEFEPPVNTFLTGNHGISSAAQIGPALSTSPEGPSCLRRLPANENQYKAGRRAARGNCERWRPPPHRRRTLREKSGVLPQGRPKRSRQQWTRAQASIRAIHAQNYKPGREASEAGERDPTAFHARLRSLPHHLDDPLCPRARALP